MARSTLFAATLLAFAGPAAAGLPAALDGSWYNPEQSGHGITLERIDHDSALLFWHVFDPSGEPLTLYVETRIEGDVMKGEVLAPTGMRFGRFEEAELALPFWGRIELSFGDCAHATLKYDSPLAGYGRGDIPLTRLLPGESNCSLQAPAGLAALAGHGAQGDVFGAYATGFEASELASPRFRGPLDGFVTDDGGLLMHGKIDPRWTTSSNDFVLVGAPQPSAAGEAKLDVRVFSNGWLNPALGLSAEALTPAGRSDRFPLELQTRRSRAKGLLLPEEPVAGAPDGHVDVLAGSAGQGTLEPGVYPFSVNGPSTDVPFGFQLEVGADLSLCVRRQFSQSSGPLPPLTPPPACVYTGHASSGTRQFEFVLERVGAAGAGPAFTGAGQARYCRPAEIFCSRFLRFVGDNGRTGMTLYSTDFQ